MISGFHGKRTTGTQRELRIIQITRHSSRDFEVTRARLDEELPLLDSAISSDLIQRQASWSEVDSVIKGELGPNGFVALSRIDQGALFSLFGEPCSATRYLVGNPLIARRVITAVPGAALYAPFSAAVYADRAGVHVSYEQPSSLLSRFESTVLDEIANELDEMIGNTVEKVT
jgi:uncharacterized protein (DUF302 family)